MATALLCITGRHFTRIASLPSNGTFPVVDPRDCSREIEVLEILKGVALADRRSRNAL
jgi:hypothetical protein